MPSNAGRIQPEIPVYSSFSVVPLLHFHPENVQNAVEIIIIEKADFDSPFAFAVAHQHFCPETLLDAGLQRGDMNIRNARRPGAERVVVRARGSPLISVVY